MSDNASTNKSLPMAAIGSYEMVLPFQAVGVKTVVLDAEKRGTFDFELDTYWLYHAGVDPIATLERLRNRVHVIHLKDGIPESGGRALGEGTAPVAAVREAAIAMGLLMVVESEGLNPTGLEEVGRCMDYLSSLEA